MFALPFALTGALLAIHKRPGEWTSRVSRFASLWIVVAMVAARSAAMGFNRLRRRELRCAQSADGIARAAARGHVETGSHRLFVVVAVARLHLFRLEAWAAVLCVVTGGAGDRVLVLAGETRHELHAAVPGLAMAVAPVGGWLAAGGRAGWEPWLLGLAIGCWVGGFDVLYACQDLAVDRAHGLHSIPVRFGVARSLTISRLMHVIAVAALAALGPVAGLGWFYLAGVAGVAVLLVFEQSLVWSRICRK